MKAACEKESRVEQKLSAAPMGGRGAAHRSNVVHKI